MSTLPIGLIIEGLVAVLLLVTIAYCWTLNGRLRRLRADEETLRATISELMTATEIAERAILGLKTTASEADKTLGNRLREAETVSHNLVDQIGEGEKIFNRISQIADAARSATAQHETASREAYAPQSQPAYAQQPRSTFAQEPQVNGYGGMNGHAVPAAPATHAVETDQTRHSRTSDIRSAAAEATARLEQFRRRKGAAA
ncbi:MAG: DUF6468 domain-containing protein [Roseibium sp.]